MHEYRNRYRPRIAVRASLQKPAAHADELGTVHEIPLTLLWNLERYL